jgi:uncharacterized protein (DUF1778 family)
MHQGAEAKTERIDIRATAGMKRVLQEAAAARNKTLTEFVLDVALTEAAGVLAEKRQFLLDDAQWAAFVAALDAPAQPKPRLEVLLSEPSVFE